MNTPKSENAMLAYSDIAQGGTSDKVYIINLEQSAGGGYTVVAQYGRRGGALATDNKTKNGAVDYDAAKNIFERVIREKIAKGYVRSDTKAPAAPVGVSASAAEEIQFRNAPIRAQELLTEIDEREAAALVLNPAYYMQDKSDGQSRGVVKVGGVIFGLNKLGKRVPLSAELHAELSQIKLSTFQIDAELVGDKLVCRDLIHADGDMHALPYEKRFVALVKAVYHGQKFKLISVVETWEGEHKRAALTTQIEERREGVVFKLRSASHRAGRNGQHKKFKFVKTLSAIAGKPHANGKASVEIFLIDKPASATRKVHVANISLIGKTKVKEGDVLEVAYLYAFPSKKLCQARMLRLRSDVEWIECTTSQLVFKRD